MQKLFALVVFLENVGHIHGLKLPGWLMNYVDFVTEEYAKWILWLYGAYRRYDQVIILEDERATGPALVETLLHHSRTHRIDLLLLAHGKEGALVGFKGKCLVGAEVFAPLIARYRADPSLLNLRAVYGLNCHGVTLAPVWMALGAQVVNGAVGVNWLPEPSLSIFLRQWLSGQSFSLAVQRSNTVASRWWRRIWRTDRYGRDHPFIASSRQVVIGKRDITIDA
jgi:hypothetical protein